MFRICLFITNFLAATCAGKAYSDLGVFRKAILNVDATRESLSEAWQGKNILFRLCVRQIRKHEDNSVFIAFDDIIACGPKT